MHEAKISLLHGFEYATRLSWQLAGCHHLALAPAPNVEKTRRHHSLKRAS